MAFFCFTYDFVLLDAVPPLNWGRKSTRLNFIHNVGFINFLMSVKKTTQSQAEQAMQSEKNLIIKGVLKTGPSLINVLEIVKDTFEVNN